MPKSQPLLLDLYPNAAVAYSLRKLRTTYSGSAIRVRRTSDNTEQDIGFDSFGNLDTEALLDFVGYNLAIWSEDLSQTTWNKSSLQVSPILINDPLGVASGRVLLETAVTSTHAVSRATSGVGGNTYTVSFWIKAQGRDNFRLTTTTGLNSRQAWLNLATGTIVSQPAPFVNLTITPDINDWYLVSFTETAANATLQISINFSPDGTTTTYLGDVTKGMAIWGLQISQTSMVKPYQKTEINAAGGGFVTTWYDQSTNGNNATQPTLLTNQAQIVSAGTVITDPITNKISTIWTNDAYSIATSFAPVQQHTQIAVFNRTALAQRIINLGSSVSSPFIGQWNTSDVVQTSYGSPFTHGTSAETGIFLQTVLRNSSNEVKAWHNNVAFPTVINSNINNSFNFWGKNSSPQSNGYKQELIYWTSDQEANRIGIETDINTYWNVY
jgi:hypothetical protein